VQILVWAILPSLSFRYINTSLFLIILVQSDDLQKRICRFLEYKWIATQGVEEDSILKQLPVDLHRHIKKWLCLDLVQRVSGIRLLLKYSAIIATINSAWYLNKEPNHNISINILGATLLCNGPPTTWCYLWAYELSPLYWGHLHHLRRRTCEGDDIHISWKARELHNWWWKDRFLQLYHLKTRRFLRWGIAHMGIASQLWWQLPIINKNSQNNHLVWGILTESRWPEVCGQHIQDDAFQAPAAHFPVPLTPMENMGSQVHSVCMEEAH